jgi:hypothetical protein
LPAKWHALIIPWRGQNNDQAEVKSRILSAFAETRAAQITEEKVLSFPLDASQLAEVSAPTEIGPMRHRDEYDPRRQADRVNAAEDQLFY